MSMAPTEEIRILARTLDRILTLHEQEAGPTSVQEQLKFMSDRLLETQKEAQIIAANVNALIYQAILQQNGRMDVDSDWTEGFNQYEHSVIRLHRGGTRENGNPESYTFLAINLVQLAQNPDSYFIPWNGITLFEVQNSLCPSPQVRDLLVRNWQASHGVEDASPTNGGEDVKEFVDKLNADELHRRAAAKRAWADHLQRKDPSRVGHPLAHVRENYGAVRQEDTDQEPAWEAQGRGSTQTPGDETGTYPSSDLERVNRLTVQEACDQAAGRADPLNSYADAAGARNSERFTVTND